MSRARDPAVTALRLAVIEVRNQTKLTHAEIARRFGITPGQVANLIRTGRARGMTVKQGGGGHPPNPATTQLRLRVVRLFNRGNTQTEVAAALSLTRGAVGRLLTEARALGLAVVQYTAEQKGKRAEASHRARIGDTAYEAWARDKMAACRATRAERRSKRAGGTTTA